MRRVVVDRTKDNFFYPRKAWSISTGAVKRPGRARATG